MWKRTSPPDDENPFGEEERPPFPSEPRRTSNGIVTSEEFIIPASEKQAYLDAHYPFQDPPRLDEQRFDLHSGKKFYVRDYKLVRENGVNYIVSPHYYESGGTIIDWMDPEGFEDEAEADPSLN